MDKEFAVLLNDVLGLLNKHGSVTPQIVSAELRHKGVEDVKAAAIINHLIKYDGILSPLVRNATTKDGIEVMQTDNGDAFLRMGGFVKLWENDQPKVTPLHKLTEIDIGFRIASGILIISFTAIATYNGCKTSNINTRVERLEQLHRTHEQKVASQTLEEKTAIEQTQPKAEGLDNNKPDCGLPHYKPTEEKVEHTLFTTEHNPE